MILRRRLPKNGAHQVYTTCAKLVQWQKKRLHG